MFLVPIWGQLLFDKWKTLQGATVPKDGAGLYGFMWSCDSWRATVTPEASALLMYTHTKTKTSLQGNTQTLMHFSGLWRPRVPRRWAQWHKWDSHKRGKSKSKASGDVTSFGTQNSFISAFILRCISVMKERYSGAFIFNLPFRCELWHVCIFYEAALNHCSEVTNRDIS